MMTNWPALVRSKKLVGRYVWLVEGDYEFIGEIKRALIKPNASLAPTEVYVVFRFYSCLRRQRGTDEKWLIVGKDRAAFVMNRSRPVDDERQLDFNIRFVGTAVRVYKQGQTPPSLELVATS